MEEFLEYQTELEAENYIKIPKKNFPNCSYIIFGKAGNLIYASNIQIGERLTASDLDIIDDFGEDVYYSVYEETDRTGGIFYRITKNSYDSEKGFTVLEGYCILDEDLVVQEGTLFSDQGYLTEQEFDFIQGFYNSKETIAKYSYETLDGEERTLVFISPRFSEKAYDALLQSSGRLWLVMIPIVLAGIIVFTVLFHRKIRKTAGVLDRSIRAYKEQTEVKEDRDKVPYEFLNTLDTLDMLIKQVEEAKQEKQRMIADISHDLKTPLSVIIGYTKAFSEGMVPPEKEVRYMRIMQERAERASGLIDSLFEYSQMEHPAYKLERKETDICEFTKEFLAEKYSEIEAAGFALSLDIPEQPVMFSMDTKLFQRILENLLNNALRYNPAGTTIFTSIEKNEKTISMVIADDGIGIKPEVAKQIFAPFVTGNAARSPGGGTGLGLSIVQRIVELHRGHIELKIPPDSSYATEFIMVFERQQ